MEKRSSLADLVGVEVEAIRAPDVANYCHPENAALASSGWGRKPKRLLQAKLRKSSRHDPSCPLVLTLLLRVKISTFC